MLIRLISDTEKKPRINTPYSKRKKGGVDTETKKYRDSTYWDHALTKFYEKSVAQTHAEAIKEWELVADGYEYYPEGRYCDLHDALTKHIYVLRNKINGNELRVGEGCAASHALPLEFKEYSKESFDAMKEKEKEVRLTAMRAVSRKYFEQHQGTLEELLDMATKYKVFIYAEGADQAIASLKKLISNYKSAKSAYEGQRENMVYWHRTELQRLDELLAPVYATLSWLEQDHGFERKMRALWNYRSLFAAETQRVIEETHLRWNRSPESINDVQLSAQDAENMLNLYEQMIADQKVVEINIAQDGQLRLTLHYLYGYQDLLDEKLRLSYAVILDAVKFLQLRSQTDIEHLQKHITVHVIPATNAGPKPADFSLSSIHTQFNRLIHGLWTGTQVILTEEKKTMETALAVLRESRISKTEARQQDQDIDQKVELVRTYGMLVGKRKYQDQLLGIIKRWDNDNFYKTAHTEISTTYAELMTKQIAIADLDKLGFSYSNKFNAIKFIARCAAVIPPLPECAALTTEQSQKLKRYANTALSPRISLNKYIELDKLYTALAQLQPALNAGYVLSEDFAKQNPGLNNSISLLVYQDQTNMTESMLSVRQKYAGFVKANIYPKNTSADKELLALITSVSPEEIALWESKNTENGIMPQNIAALLGSAKMYGLLLTQNYQTIQQYYANPDSHATEQLKAYIGKALQGNNHLEQTVAAIQAVTDADQAAHIVAAILNSRTLRGDLWTTMKNIFSYWHGNKDLHAFCINLAYTLLAIKNNANAQALLKLLYEQCAFTDEELLIAIASQATDPQLIAQLPLAIIKEYYTSAIVGKPVSIPEKALWETDYRGLSTYLPGLILQYIQAVRSNSAEQQPVLSQFLSGLTNSWSTVWFKRICAVLTDAYLANPHGTLTLISDFFDKLPKSNGHWRQNDKFMMGAMMFLEMLVKNKLLAPEHVSLVKDIAQKMRKGAAKTQAGQLLDLLDTIYPPQ